MKPSPPPAPYLKPYWTETVIREIIVNALFDSSIDINDRKTYRCLVPAILKLESNDHSDGGAEEQQQFYLHGLLLVLDDYISTKFHYVFLALIHLNSFDFVRWLASLWVLLTRYDVTIDVRRIWDPDSVRSMYKHGLEWTKSCFEDQRCPI